MVTRSGIIKRDTYVWTVHKRVFLNKETYHIFQNVSCFSCNFTLHEFQFQTDTQCENTLEGIRV